jgi:acyl carrier protein
MDRQKIKLRLSTIFQDLFDDESIQVRDEMTAADVDGWDSLAHINLIVAVEKEFKIKLTTAEVRSLNNAGDFISLIQKKAA